jgi:hypothetical protein
MRKFLLPVSFIAVVLNIKKVQETPAAPHYTTELTFSGERSPWPADNWKRRSVTSTGW